MFYGGVFVSGVFVGVKAGSFVKCKCRHVIYSASQVE